MILLEDLRFVLRQQRRSPVSTLAIVLSVALPIAINASVFSVIDVLLLGPVPGTRDSARLLRLGGTEAGQGHFTVSVAEYEEIRDRASQLSGVAAHRFNQTILQIDGAPREVGTEIVSANYFEVLGAGMTLGRGFGPAEALPLATPAVIIGHRLWQREYGADPEVVGRSAKVSGLPVTIVGVAAPEFSGAFAGFDIQLWVPLGIHDRVLPRGGSIAERNDRIVNVIARIQAQSTRAEIQSQLDAIAAGWEQPLGAPTRGLEAIAALGTYPFIVTLARGFLGLLMGITLLLLLIACANVAGLLLARAGARRREVAVRRALGASGGRLTRLVLTEAVLLGCAGGVGGLLGTVWLTGLLSSVSLPVGIPVRLGIGVNGRVVVFCALASLATAVIFGLAPALRSARADLMQGLRDASGGGGPRGRMRRALVVLQVAVSCALLVAAGLLVRSLLASRDLDIGIASAGVLTVHADAGTLGEEEATIRAFWHALRERTGALPGVAETSLTLFVPLAGRSDRMLAAPADSPDQPRPTQYNLTSPGYLRLLQIDLVAGRGFDARDIDGGADVAIVNERLASDWLQGEPLGRSLRIVDRGGLQRLVTVVGVAEDSTYRRLGEPPTPYIYLPETQWYRPDLVLLARARSATDTAAAVTSIGRSLLPGLPLRIESMQQAMGFAFIVPRVLSTTFATAGGMGLVLATIGLFGVVSHLTQQRMHEFGVRAAVGAQARDLRKLVLLSALRLSALGLMLGLLLALASGRLLASFLFGVGASDPLTYALVAIVLLVATGAAAYQPARRAMRLDPVQVLRSE